MSTSTNGGSPKPGRSGWSWTLTKCAMTLVATAVLGTIGMVALLRKVLDWLPGWLPAAWVRWAFEWMLAHVWFIGPAVGALVGLLISVGIVAFDAKRGRLTRVP